MISPQFSSLALISGRATINALDTLTVLMSSYLYVLCQGKLQRFIHAFSRYPRLRSSASSILLLYERRLLTY